MSDSDSDSIEEGNSINIKDYFQKQQERDREIKKQQELEKQNNTENITIINENNGDNGNNNNIGNNQNNENSEPHHTIGDDIPGDKLREHIERLTIEGFDEEFFTLEKQSDNHYYNDFSHAVKPFNFPKNRYTNILPLDNTRVILEVDEDNKEEGSDYINANYVDGINKNDYIASQGPLPSTTNDYWKMIWETKCDVIVMLTKLVERIYEKCFLYWPSLLNQSTEYGKLKLKLIKKDKCEGIVTRTFELEYNNEIRIVNQFQYKEWPDHGLPSSAKVFRDLLRKVNEAHKTGPILVHCSAGIGRTGTFCSIHKIIGMLHEHMKEKPNEIPTFNIYETVLTFRNFRVGMVQTREQYEFCYRAILEEYENLLRENKVNSNYPQQIILEKVKDVVTKDVISLTINSSSPQDNANHSKENSQDNGIQENNKEEE